MNREEYKEISICILELVERLVDQDSEGCDVQIGDGEMTIHFKCEFEIDKKS